MSMLMIQILSRDMTSQMKISKWLGNRHDNITYDANITSISLENFDLACHIICMYNVARLS